MSHPLPCFQFLRRDPPNQVCDLPPQLFLWKALIVTRIKTHLPRLTDNGQTDFIKGHFIAENI